jgi:hypothetical protein
MSTCLATPEDFKFFDFLAPYRWPGESPKTIAKYRELVASGEIQIETLTENALVQASNGLYTRVCEDANDFSDGSESKKAVSQFRNNNIAKCQWTNSFAITNLTNKTGLVRCVCYSRQQDRFYFFAIPYKAYRNMARIDIILDSSTGYREPRGIPQGKWSHYQVDSFEQLAQLDNQGAYNPYSQFETLFA